MMIVRRRHHRPTEHPQRGRLAGPIWPHQAKDFTPAQRQLQVIHSHQFAEAPGQLSCLNRIVIIHQLNP